MAESLHNKLLTDITDMMEVDSQEYESFVFHMTQFVPKGLLRSKPNLLGKFGAMKSKGKLDVGNYESLKKVAKDSGNNDVLELIEEEEGNIQQAIARDQSKITAPSTRTPVATGHSSTQAAGVGQSTPGVLSGHNNPGVSGKQVKSATPDVNIGTDKKRKLDDAKDQADPLYGKDALGRGKYDTDGKRGYLLILDYKRTGLGNDVRNLEEFFGAQLGFEVKTISGELSAKQVWRGLDEARVKLNGDTNRHYYAFVCVILSHGNEVGIEVKDKETISTADIRKHFTNNEHTKTFAGRPKLFFIQSCRGYGVQDLHEVKDEDDFETETAVIDESDEIFNVPTDADTLIAFANTPGYATYGDTRDRTTQYTFFIHALLQVFRKYYQTDHVEDMLISVREMLALGETKYYHHVLCKQTKQMPCTWSTLTKRLYLTPYQRTPMEM